MLLETTGTRKADASTRSGYASLGRAISARIDHEENLAPPSAVAPSEIAIALPLRLAAKATVYVFWRDAKISKSELGRRMGRTETEARRILDPYHGTKLDQIETAAEALGAKLAVEIAPTPPRERTAAAG